MSSWVLKQIGVGNTYRLRNGETFVGRHCSSTVCMDTRYVSNHHALIVVTGDKTVTIKDLNSINGIFVNAVHHRAATVTLTKGDKIGIGVWVDNPDKEDAERLPICELKYEPIATSRLADAIQHKRK